MLLTGNMNDYNIDVYWDLENIRPGRDSKIIDITNQIRSCLQQFGMINKKNIYIDSQSPNEAKTKRGEMCLAGWNVLDTPHRNKKETIYKKIIMDVLSSIITSGQSKRNMMVCIITTDSDFAELFCRIRDFGVHTCLFYGTNPSQPLINSAEYTFNWNDDIISRIDDASLYHDIEVDEDELEIFAQRLAEREFQVSKLDSDEDNEQQSEEDEESDEDEKVIGEYPEANYIPEYSPSVDDEENNIQLSRECKNILILAYTVKDDKNCIRLDTLATQWYKSQYAKELGKKTRQNKLRLLINESIKNNILKRVTKMQKLTLKQKKGEIVKFTTEGLQYMSSLNI